MAIINRIGRLFKADMHAVIDRLEEPYMLLKQSVREMEEIVIQNRQQHRQIQQQYNLLQGRINELQDVVTKIDSEMDLCFEENNERLARVLIKRKLESQQLLKTLLTKQHSLQQEIAAITATIDERGPTLEAMKQKLELLEEERPSHETSLITPLPAAVTDADVEITLLRELQLRKKKIRGNRQHDKQPHNKPSGRQS